MCEEKCICPNDSGNIEKLKKKKKGVGLLQGHLKRSDPNPVQLYFNFPMIAADIEDLIVYVLFCEFTSNENH